MVQVEFDGNESYFDQLITPSEHSTVQVVVFKKENIKKVILAIEKLGCSWEGTKNQKILAIDIPPLINYPLVKEYLNKSFKLGLIDFKEARLAK